MKINTIAAFFSIVCAPVQMLSADNGNTRLIVQLNGLRNDQGHVQLRLWSSKAGFPTNDAKAFRSVTVDIHNGTASVVMADIPSGIYAISAYHDENGNGKFDTRFPGIPTEGYAISNGGRGKLGPPPFEPAKVNVQGTETTVTIAIQY